MYSISTSIQYAKEEYLDLGFSPIPLRPGTKEPFCIGWNRVDPYHQWEDAPPDANIGLRCGGDRNLCVIDTDDKKVPTFEKVMKQLYFDGIEPDTFPVISTPSGGHHIYLKGVLENAGAWRLINPVYGAGEIRYGDNAYVVAPPSTTRIGSYILTGDLRELPLIETRFLKELTSNKEFFKHTQTPSLHRPSRNAFRLLNGIGYERFQSRSEAEQSILTSLANSGFEFDEVLRLFLHYPAFGKFHEIYEKDQGSAIAWLKQSYLSAQEWASMHESKERIAIMEVKEWAISTPWLGPTALSDQATFLAHLNIAYEAGKSIYAASSRRVAEIACISRITASRATTRLCLGGYMKLKKSSTAELSNVYELMLHQLTTSQIHCEEVVNSCDKLLHDAFRKQGLGKSAGQIYMLLKNNSLTIKGIAERTGRHQTTVRRNLQKMLELHDEPTGELFSLVQNNDSKWSALPVDLDKIAMIVGTAGMKEKQCRKHAQEREAHNRQIQDLEKKIDDSNVKKE